MTAFRRALRAVTVQATAAVTPHRHARNLL